MNGESIRIAWACLLGAFVGAVCALKLGPNYPKLVWLGLLAGGFVGYLTYRFKDVVKAIATVCKGLFPKGSSRKYTSWKEWRNSEKFKTNFTAVLCFLAFLSMFSFLLTTLEVFDIFVVTRKIEPYLTKYPFHVYIGGFVWMALLASLAMWINKCDKNSQELALFFMLATPALFPFSFVGALSWLFFRDVVPPVFRAIHSNIRLLCATDSVLGGLIGYWIGKGAETSGTILLAALFGAVAGALLGVLNYRLVSIKWLKLVPKAT